jgi:type I restriction enzyme S subunit
LSEISLITSIGVTPRADNAEYYDGDIPWLRTQEVRFVDIWDTEMRVTEKAMKETSLKWVPVDSVIVAISGATAGRVGINKIPLTTNQHCCCFEINQEKASYRYVFHCLANANEEILKLKQGVRGDLNAGLMRRFLIPIPSLYEQERIVAILDKFDALTTDITIGLPAEIEARRKQYEYYRDKLLTFKENAA